MIINQDNGLEVPEKTIAFFPVAPSNNLKPFDLNDVGLFLRPLNLDHKREWFKPNFYKCLPLSIANMQGFVFSLPYKFSVLWNGGSSKEDIYIEYYEDFEKYKGINFITPISVFGDGIFTIQYPLTLKTPPGINLMTIAPPNFPLAGLSPMSGVVESDNLRFSFSLNIKIDLSNVKIVIEENTPLIGMLPIPRYFCDSFELKNAYDIFDKKIVEEEIKVVSEHSSKRDSDNEKGFKPDKTYFTGYDIKGNKFKDHQLPKKK